MLGGWDPINLILFFIFGYIFSSEMIFKESFEKHALLTLITGVIFTILWVFFPLNNAYLYFSIRFLSGWCFLIALLGFGSKYLNQDHKSLKLLNDIVLPFYILHQIVIIVVGYYIIGLDLSVLGKYLIISSISLVIILALVMGIRKVNPLRFLFGMRMIKKKKE